MQTADFTCSACLHHSGHFVMRRSEHAVVRCAQCGLAHLLPRPEAAQDSHQLDDLRYYDDLMRRLRPGLDYHSTKLLRLLHPYSPPPGRLLEIGCATGRFLMAAKTAGYFVMGLEPAAGHRQIIPSEIAASVLPHKLEEADLPSNAFDIIVAIQLLEHLLNPAIFAEELKRVLKPGGIAYVETPNFDCVSRLLQIQSWMDTNVTAGHWHLFNSRSIDAFCRQMGLRVVRCWTFFKALGLHSRSELLGRSIVALDYTLGRAGMGNNVAVLITRD
jgi:SAM-dependent methyltransferase